MDMMKQRNETILSEAYKTKHELKIDDDYLNIECIAKMIDDDTLLNWVLKDPTSKNFCDSFLERCFLSVINHKTPKSSDLLNSFGETTSRYIRDLEYECKQEYSQKTKQIGIDRDQKLGLNKNNNKLERERLIKEYEQKIKLLNKQHFIDDNLNICRMDPETSDICRDICHELGEDNKYFHIIRLIYIMSRCCYEPDSIPDTIDEYLLKDIDGQSFVNWFKKLYRQLNVIENQMLPEKQQTSPTVMICLLFWFVVLLVGFKNFVCCFVGWV